MPGAETTTIRVRRSTQQRLQKEAELAGTSLTQILEKATVMLEEQRLMEGFVRSYEKHGAAIRAEMRDWLEMPGPPLPDDDWSDTFPDEG
jgi:hypothetical protein